MISWQRPKSFASLLCMILPHEAEKKRLIDLYAAGELSEEAYVNGNVALDGERHGLRCKRAELVPLLHSADAIDASVRAFCETARARLEACRHPESKRQFLLGYVQRVDVHEAVEDGIGDCRIDDHLVPDGLIIRTAAWIPRSREGAPRNDPREIADFTVPSPARRSPR
jgi:hypothetical protein